MKNNRPFLLIFLVMLSPASYVYAASTCKEYCTGKGYAGGYCFNYDDSTKSEDVGWVEHGANDGACSTDLTKCNYAIVAIGCHDLDDGSKNICGDCSAMHANIWCNCYKTMDCPTNCRSECKSTGCRNSAEISSDATCGTSCTTQDCSGAKCTGGSCTPTPGLGETWSGGVCYFGVTYVKNANCPGATGAAGYCSCWRSQPCPDTSAEGLAGMAENKCDAKQGCRTAEFITSSTTTTTTPGTEGGMDSSKVIDLIKTAVYKIVMTLYCLVLYIASAVAALFIIITGIKYMSSDEEGGRAESRKRMVYAIAGLMVVVLACPLVNFLFAGTNIGIPNASGGKDACPPCPIIGQLSSTGGGLGGWTGGYSGGGDTGGSWFTPDRIKQAESFQECSDPKTCPSGKVCATTAGTYRCYPKIADGYSISESGLKPLPPGTNVNLCNSGYSLGDKCAHNPICSNAADCKNSDEYCPAGKNMICAKKKATGTGSDSACSASMIFGDSNPDVMCTSKWCIEGYCSAAGACASSDDCDKHYSGGYYCKNVNGEGKCTTKLTKGRCDSLEIKGEDNRVCSSGKCGIPAGSSQTSKECI